MNQDPAIVSEDVHETEFSQKLKLAAGHDATVMKSMPEVTKSVITDRTLKRTSSSPTHTEHPNREAFFRLLFSSDDQDRKFAMEQMDHYGLQKDAYYSVVAVEISKDASGIQSEIEMNQTLSKISYLVDLTRQSLERIQGIFPQNNSVNILLIWSDTKNYSQRVRMVAESIDRLLERMCRTVDYRIGIGQAYYGIEEARNSLNDAEKSAVAARTYMNVKIAEFEKLGAYRILSQDSMKGELLGFYNSVLKPLVDYDQKTNGELVKSLQMYFNANGNLKKMSEMMYTHYNTSIYRLNRIREITGRNLKSEIDRYDLNTALKIMHILGL